MLPLIQTQEIMDMYFYDTLMIQEVTVEHQHDPVGIDCLEPRFAWKLEANGKNVFQCSYRLRILDETSETVPVFDSGKVVSAQSIEVTADGFLPQPKTEYLVQLTVWDQQGREAYSETRFETGLMDTIPLGGWIEPVQEPTSSSMDMEHIGDAISDTDIPRDENGERTYEEFRPAQYIRIPFSADQGEGIRRARIYATAHGLYRLFVNGMRPDDREFAPENTAYEKVLYYQTYNVTSLLRAGKNVIGIILADGWWVGRVGTTGDCCQYGNTVGLWLFLEILYTDGSRQVVNGNDGVSSIGPIIFSDLFVGEKYDARLEKTDWCIPGFDESSWAPVEMKDWPTTNLTAQCMPPVRTYRIFSPTGLFTAANGDLILDAGQVVSGVTEFTCCAPAGLEIRMEHFEVLGPDGGYFDSILNVNKDQTDIYITKEGWQRWHPAFTYHGFRYVRLSCRYADGGTGQRADGTAGDTFCQNWLQQLQISHFRIISFSSDMNETGAFSCSDERLNQLWENIRWSQISNTISIPTDCPQREKAGWTGDIMAFAPTMCFNSEADAFLTSWLANLRAEQLKSGAVPMIVPYLKAYATFIKDNLGTDTSCGWGDAVIMVPYAMYLAYGDRRVLEENYEAMTAWMEYIRSRAENVHPEGYENWPADRQARSRYLWNTDFHFGDWLIPSMVLGNPDGMAMNQTAYATMGVVAPAYYAFSAKNMARIAAALGKQDDVSYYEALYGKIREAFIDEYVHADGTMDADFQGIYVIALQMGLVPERTKPMMVQHLCDLIHNNGDKLDTGFLSVLFLMDVLCDNGREDVAYRLLMQTGCPSWLYEVMCGATTMWESWGAIGEDGSVSTYSYNHYAFGCVGDWMARHIGGLCILEPGYKKILIKPHFMPGLSYAEATQETPYGRAEVSWRRIGEAVAVHVKIPVNTQAVIRLPGMDENMLGSGTYDFLVNS